MNSQDVLKCLDSTKFLEILQSNKTPNKFWIDQGAELQKFYQKSNIYYGNLCDICNVMKKELDKIRLPERHKSVKCRIHKIVTI